MRMMLYDFVILLFCINYSMLCAVCPREHLCCSFDIHDLFMFACFFFGHVRFFLGGTWDSNKYHQISTS